MSSLNPTTLEDAGAVIAWHRANTSRGLGLRWGRALIELSAGLVLSGLGYMPALLGDPLLSNLVLVVGIVLVFDGTLRALLHVFRALSHDEFILIGTQGIALQQPRHPLRVIFWHQVQTIDAHTDHVRVATHQTDDLTIPPTLIQDTSEAFAAQLQAYWLDLGPQTRHAAQLADDP